jgi:hypothetical protein
VKLAEDVVERFLARCRAEWAEAGLPEHVEDPDVLDRLARIVVEHQNRPEND